MPDSLKPGQMGSPASANTPSVFTDSMAADIEAAFNALLDEEDLPRMPNDNSKESRDRRRLFVAIARGIVRHLDEHRQAITVTIPDGGGTRSPVFDIDGKDW